MTVLVVKQMELLAELHFKLAREHPTAKMEKMVQDWEKTLGRKVQENWPKTFTVNPMGGGVTYQDLTVLERVRGAEYQFTKDDFLRHLG
ncbi:hypothetical protein PsorP6_002137 [Peronosclerospora sorghi]|uniref:Uncharacterized protein n=1 Tax=Peronosclerospora sorghi TaxID=230839 RepID=A0ACC0WTC5_9STRA|nr:hypothetical protein PsorP6_002137 [Peronosclerospora sorghi]